LPAGTKGGNCFAALAGDVAAVGEPLLTDQRRPHVRDDRDPGIVGQLERRHQLDPVPLGIEPAHVEEPEIGAAAAAGAEDPGADRQRFDGFDDWKGSALTINFQNEWIVAYRDGEPLAMTPDLICVLDSVSGEAVGSETIRYGQRVTVIALPPPPVFLSPKGLQHVGPRAFGYDIEFKSVFA